MNTEVVTFSAGILARRDDLRVMANDLKTQDDALFLPVWKLKPLVQISGGLMFLPADHTLVDPTREMVFLGLNDHGAPMFAMDVSQLELDEGTPEVIGLLDAAALTHPDLVGAAFVEIRAVMSQLTPEHAEIASTARAVLGWHRSHKFCSACGAQSRAIFGGWKRECPTCRAQHFPRTDPVVIMLVTFGNSVLLGRSPHFPSGMYSLLAGFIEPGEPIEAAVRREVMEEAGVVIGDVSYMTSQPWPFPSSLMIGCSAQALSRDIVLDENELEDAFWMTKEDCANMVAGRHPEFSAPREGTIAQFLLTKWLADQ
jgi:NAD+ diphosphatase